MPAKKESRNWIQEYFDSILSGSVLVGVWIQKLYEIVLQGLEDGEFFYSQQITDKAIGFVEDFCHHCESRNDLLKLELWQKATVSVIFGIVDEKGIRIWREVFLVVARKNGKTLFAAAIIAYLAYVDGEYGAKIYCLAPKLDQSMLVYENFYQMVLNEPELADITKKRRSDIYIAETNTTVRPLAFSSKKSDGFNPHGVINDELASWVGDGGLKQYEVMKSALGARLQPLILSITTAGYVNDGIYDELMKRSTAFLKGSSKERRLLPILYLIDDPSKWKDFKELRKANPNMGVSVFEDYFREEIAVALNSASKKREFLTKYCNIKQNSSVAWLDYQVVANALKAGEHARLEDFRGCYAVAGIDLSKTIDLTAASVIITRGGKHTVFTRFFMPAERIRAAQEFDGVPYELFVQKGLIQPSGENHVNYRDLFDWIVEVQQRFGIYILKVGYDRYCATYLIDSLKEYGFHVDDVHQGYNLSPVLDEFEGVLKDGNVIIGEDNQLLGSHFLNVALKQDLETRKNKPIKIEQRAHIDGFVSAIDAWTVRQKYFQEIGSMLQNADVADQQEPGSQASTVTTQ